MATSTLVLLLCSIILASLLCSVSSHAATSLSYSSQTTNTEEGWRESLPTKLRDNQGAPLHRVIIQPQAWSKSCTGNATVTIYLLGTSHVSRTSCQDAELLMDHVRPDCLFVELCSQRVGLMLPAHEATPDVGDEKQTHNKQQQRGMSPISHKSAGLFAKIQNDYASKLNVTIGGEFKTAFQSALRQQREFWNSRQNYYLNVNNGIGHPRANRPCAIVLGDRPVRITLLRAWESLRLFGKIKLVLALLWSSIKQPSEKELREWMESILNDRTGKSDLMKKAMDEMAKSFPTLKRVIIDERDEFMVAKIKQTAELLACSTSTDGERVMVAVIGAGHCNGIIEKLLDTKPSPQPEEILPSITRTKRKAEDDFEGSDVVQFDYAYAIETGMI
ncbi:TraB domain-containing protein [Skeletonema marinoi]|uniref:TraB domain-containing protein n=1 Tax=Skeletonema marinoi TaxID=267567 RepID=A0AAD9D6F2_9STRA|nr:TraB domain-containing protein [Skeletonema marinoi]